VVGGTIEQYGGRFLARIGPTELIEGGPEPKRIVSSNSDKARPSASTIHRSKKNFPGRLDNSTARDFVVEGVS
jgi:uncharacterized protein (DUF1330 family)